MNILYIINHAGKGGTEKYVRTLIDHFKDAHNIYFIYNEHGNLSEELIKMNINVTQIKMTSPLDIKASYKISVFCKKYNIDIVHTQFQRESYLCALSKKLFFSKFKLVYTCHINIPNTSIRNLTNKLLNNVYDQIIAVSSNGKNMLVSNNFSANKIEIIFNGVIYENYLKKSSKDIRQNLNISVDTFVFSTLTRFSDEKGNLFLLKSIKKLTEITTSKFCVIFAGDGPLIDECKQYAKINNLNNVYFLGYRTDSKDILINSDAFLNSSSNEALSFAILEAMSMKLPLVLTNVGGNKDIINNNSNCGVLADYGNINEYSNAMKQILEDTIFYNKCAENSLLSIKNIFDLSITLSKTNDIYERLTNYDR